MSCPRTGFGALRAITTWIWCALLACGPLACQGGAEAGAEPSGVLGTGSAGAGAVHVAGATSGPGGSSGTPNTGGASGFSASIAGAPAGHAGDAPSAGGSSAGSAGTALAGPLGKFEPADGHTLLVIGQDTASIEEYASRVTPMPGGVMLYSNIADLAGVAFAASFGAGQEDLPHWSSNPQKFVLQIGLLLKDALPGMASGALDGNIDQLADLLHGTKRPIFLRVGYEFDSDWANYEPKAYIAAFQHLVDRFRKKGADNVMFVWHAWGYQHSFGQSTVLPWYPGDGYVDWVGVSFFPGWDNASIQAADGAREEISSFANLHHKPFMIAESAPKQQYQPSRGADSWNGWYAPLLDFIVSHDVKLFSYINANWDAQPLWTGQGWGDTRVQTNAYVLGQWQQKLAGARFIQASEHLYSPL